MIPTLYCAVVSDEQAFTTLPEDTSRLAPVLYFGYFYSEILSLFSPIKNRCHWPELVRNIATNSSVTRGMGAIAPPLPLACQPKCRMKKTLRFKHFWDR